MCKEFINFLSDIGAVIPLIKTVPSDRIETSLVSLTTFDVNDSVFGSSNERNCESPTLEVTTKNITRRKTISINGVISMEKLELFVFKNFIIYLSHQ